MPESQVSNFLAHQAMKALRTDFKKSGVWPVGRLVLFPRTFAMGTDVKSYQTISVDSGDYDVRLEPRRNWHQINAFDAQRVPAAAPWKYLVDRPLLSGDVFVKVRGKCIAISCGYHALVCHMSLEGNLRTMSRADFDALVSVCVPGSNKDKQKALKMRSFQVPERFIEPGSHEKGLTVNIMAAVVTTKRAIVLMDYSRMSRVHIVSMSRKFTKEDLTPGSEVWPRLWEKFPGGPDWVVELEEALAFLELWRQGVIANEDATPIIDVLTTADGPGGGIGKQLANDVLFEVAIHPDMPSFELCTDEEQYGRFKAHLPVFMSTWVSPKFLELCGGTPNSSNPLAFNSKSDQNFLRGYVRTYRRKEVRVHADLYNLYASLGYLDPTHAIGTPYTRQHEPIAQKFKELKVRKYLNGQVNRYHIIAAAVPAHWVRHPEDSSFGDVTNAGYLTTLGCASFREPMHNKIDLNKAKALVRPGRPPKIRTGQPGRPRNAITTKKLQAISDIPRKRFRTDKKELDKENEVAESQVADGPRRSKRRRTAL
ncbi:hypothetical protein DFH06DRAFT_1042758 [Mycena polygramma]|nr:hypothetical protein DFH06DRAFT_1042758 [Mycena polygramma]